MRVTNAMITNGTKSNINRNKVSVDKYNTQMTTQKKISKPSESPVIAIRSLRLSTNLSHIEQYANNIKDANSWLDVTATALKNMKSLLTDIRTQCVNGSSDTLTAEDRQTILTNLSQLADQVYSEGNADYAGRTVFTGYRTSSNLTFDEAEPETKYQIKQKFTYQDIEEHRYYSGTVNVPADATAVCDTDTIQHDYQRIRLAYDGTSGVDSISYTTYGADGTPSMNTLTVTEFDSEDAWLADRGGKEKTIGADEVIFIKDTGEFVMDNTTANQFIAGKAEFEVLYTKTGFEAGELRPEFYYDCTKTTGNEADGSAVTVNYKKDIQDIKYEISNATTLTVNTQASDVFSTSIGRDVTELINVVQSAITAQEKVDQIKEMMSEAQYADKDSQDVLQGYLDAANKELSYAEDNLQKTYEQYITNFNGYLENVNVALTNVGSTQVRVTMTETRVDNQQTTVTELKSSNEDRDLSDIVIDYYAAYYAYQASLTAAGKLNERTLLDYI